MDIYHTHTHSSKLHSFFVNENSTSAFLSKMFDVGDLLVLTFGNCALKAGVIKWPLKLRVRFYVFQNPKT